MLKNSEKQKPSQVYDWVLLVYLLYRPAAKKTKKHDKNLKGQAALRNMVFFNYIRKKNMFVELCKGLYRLASVLGHGVFAKRVTDYQKMIDS